MKTQSSTRAKQQDESDRKAVREKPSIWPLEITKLLITFFLGGIAVSALNENFRRTASREKETSDRQHETEITALNRRYSEAISREREFAEYQREAFAFNERFISNLGRIIDLTRQIYNEWKIFKTPASQLIPRYQAQISALSGGEKLSAADRAKFIEFYGPDSLKDAEEAQSVIFGYLETTLRAINDPARYHLSGSELQSFLYDAFPKAVANRGLLMQKDVLLPPFRVRWDTRRDHPEKLPPYIRDKAP